jgi:hypothetical protein
MSAYTNPIEATFELQRQSLKQGQELLSQGVEIQQQVGESVIKGIESQEQFQRRLVEYNQDAVTDVIEIAEDATELETADGGLRDNLDEGYDELLSRHADAFESITKELGEHGIDPSEELSEEFVDAVEEQLDLLLEAHEDVEAESVEIAEDIENRLNELQTEAEEIGEDLAEEVQA